jgi:hypothetical protein
MAQLLLLNQHLLFLEARMKAFFRSKITALSAAILLLLSAAPAQAVPTINFSGFIDVDAFNGNPNEGQLIANPGGIFIGQRIPITLVTFIDTPQNPGATFPVVGGVLDFNTQQNVITIAGEIPTLGIPNSPNNPLLQGSFAPGGFGIIANTFFVNGFDTKAPQLLAPAGILPGTPFIFGGTIQLSPQGPSGVVFNAFNADINNTPVPEPSSLLLLGSGLVALGLAARRKKA